MKKLLAVFGFIFIMQTSVAAFDLYPAQVNHFYKPVAVSNSFEKTVFRLKQLAKKNPDGFTVWTKDLSPVKKGWCVGMLATQHSFGDAGLRKALHIAIKTTHVIGGWRSGNLYYWDAVMLYHNERDATSAGIRNKQQSIYNIETGKLKRLSRKVAKTLKKNYGVFATL